MKIIHSIPLAPLVLICLTLGLAPFTPEPHVWEKLKMLFSGTLSAPIDMLDLLMHGAPWLLLIARFAIPAPDEDPK